MGVTATARYAQRKSSLDGDKHTFYTITNGGKAADGSKCSADTFVRIGTCKTCCCSELIQYEIQSNDRSGTKACRDWFLTASQAHAHFFGMWRLKLALKKIKDCT